MSYRINDIFYSLQGEGRNTGRAAVFVRFAGCNLRCPFCDTEFDSYQEMTADDILHAIASAIGGGTANHTPLIVLTGGEPTLQVDEDFVDLLHRQGYEVAMESNGTRPAPCNLDWLTVSPKGNLSLSPSEGRGRLPDEIKIVFDENTAPDEVISQFSILNSQFSILHSQFSILHSQFSILLYLQPCDTGDPKRNALITRRCVDYIKQHPWWRLSLQTHKLIGIE